MTCFPLFRLKETMHIKCLTQSFTITSIELTLDAFIGEHNQTGRLVHLVEWMLSYSKVFQLQATHNNDNKF